jgi:membrane peptidoglycan carboxypeptidase
MRTALIDSRNIPALKAFQEVDSKTRLEWISSLGLHPELEGGIIHEAHATGGYTGEAPLSMAAAYNAFASKGYYIEPYSVTKIEYNDGSEPFEYKYTMNKVMSEETAWMITNVLISVARGTGFSGYYVNGVNYAGKSGTTNLSKEDLAYWGLPSKAVSDLWAVGYTDKYTIATWYGYDTLKDGHNMFGSGQNYRIFTAVAKGIFNEQSVFPKPDGVVPVETEIGCYEACLPSEFTPADMRMTEYYKKGYEPSTTSDRFAKLDNVTNLKASAKGSKVTLTWDAIKTPHALDIDYLKAYMAGAYKKADWGENAATTRYNENLGRLGTVVYEVYEQIGDKLKLVKSTDKTEITVDASTPNPTFTVKTSYTIFKDNRSDGASIKVTGLSVSDLITATQNTKKATVKPTDTKLENESKIATVEVNGIAADSSKVAYIYTLEKNKQDGDIYKLPVKVLYNNSLVDTFTIDITVKENTSSN